MIAHLNYLKYVLRHKWLVFLEGRKLGLGIWQLLIHDLSKFSRAEWTPYVDRFMRKDSSLRASTAFEDAWRHHYENNKHHWNYWLRDGSDATVPNLMPKKYALEMVADWSAMGRGFGEYNPPVEWYRKNRATITMHPATKDFVEKILVKRGL